MNTSAEELEEDSYEFEEPSKKDIAEVEQDSDDHEFDYSEMTDYVSNDALNHKILTREQEIEIASSMENALDGYTEKITNIGLTALRIAQIAQKGVGSEKWYIHLDHHFQKYKLVFQSASNSIPEIYELVHASRAILSSEEISPSAEKTLDKNSLEQAKLICPWRPRVSTLEERMEGDDYYAGLRIYEKKINDWKVRHKKGDLNNREYRALYQSVAKELGIIPETFLDIMVDISKYQREYNKHRDMFLLNNQKFVMKIAHKMKNRLFTSYLTFPDLYSTGNQGLIKATERFDRSKGYKFSTYATWWIRQAMTREIYDSGKGVRVPVYVIENAHTVSKAINELRQEHGEDYRAETMELAIMTGLEERQVLRALNMPIASSLDAKIGEDGEDDMYNYHPDESQKPSFDIAQNSLLKNNISQALATLSEREREIIELRYGLNGEDTYTQEEIGKKYGLTRQRIEQIESKAMRKLRHPVKQKMLGISSADFDY